MNRKRILRTLFSLVAAVGLFASGSAHAQSCTSYVADKLNWMASSPDHYLDVKGTSINASHGGGLGLVSYVEGYLAQYQAGYTYFDFVTSRWITVPARASSHDNYQSFSDRYATGYQPFNKNARDQLGITLDGNGKLTITLDSWGGGAVTVTATSCTSEVIYGSSADGTHWAFVLHKGIIPG
jgi:hypothetical protein